MRDSDLWLCQRLFDAHQLVFVEGQFSYVQPPNVPPSGRCQEFYQEGEVVLIRSSLLHWRWATWAGWTSPTPPSIHMIACTASLRPPIADMITIKPGSARRLHSVFCSNNSFAGPPEGVLGVARRFFIWGMSGLLGGSIVGPRLRLGLSAGSSASRGAAEGGANGSPPSSSLYLDWPMALGRALGRVSCAPAGRGSGQPPRTGGTPSPRRF